MPKTASRKSKSASTKAKAVRRSASKSPAKKGISFTKKGADKKVEQLKTKPAKSSKNTGNSLLHRVKYAYVPKDYTLSENGKIMLSNITIAVAAKLGEAARDLAKHSKDATITIRTAELAYKRDFYDPLLKAEWSVEDNKKEWHKGGYAPNDAAQINSESKSEKAEHFTLTKIREAVLDNSEYRMGDGTTKFFATAAKEITWQFVNYALHFGQHTMMNVNDKRINRTWIQAALTNDNFWSNMLGSQ